MYIPLRESCPIFGRRRSGGYIFFRESKNILRNCGSKYAMKTRDDSTTCIINGICRLPDGRTVVIDFDNGTVKLLDLSYGVVHRLQLKTGPEDVCVTGPAEVAVSLLKEQTIVFLSVGGTLTITREFPIGQYCRGMVLYDRHIYVVCRDSNTPGTGRVLVYSVGGEKQREIGGPVTGGTSMFSRPNYITMEGGRIYVSDFDKGVIVMDTSGRVLSVISDLTATVPGGICRGAAGQVLVCCGKTHSVVRLGPGLHDVSTVVQTDVLCRPYVVCYDTSRHQLLVSIYESDLLHVLDISL